jgi:hypothetical protein
VKNSKCPGMAYTRNVQRGSHERKRGQSDVR